jgi:hypothetical protein
MINGAKISGEYHHNPPPPSLLALLLWGKYVNARSCEDFEFTKLMQARKTLLLSCPCAIKACPERR